VPGEDSNSARRCRKDWPDDPTEYAEFFAAMYPTEEERRIYIDTAVRWGTPSFGHRVVASLVASGAVPCVFTTNFDPLVETACTQTDQLVSPDARAHCTVAALDSSARAERCLRESDWPLFAKLHGDYQSSKIKNTVRELQTQDAIMRGVLTGAPQRFGLIVIGYSGRDASIMELLGSVLKSATRQRGDPFGSSSMRPTNQLGLDHLQ